MERSKLLNNLGGYPDIDSFVRGKLDTFSGMPKTMKSLYGMMFSERENTFAEYTDGYRIKKICYGEAEETVRRLSTSVAGCFSSLPKDSIVGMYMENSPLWIESFWALLMAGFRVLLLNRYHSVEDLEKILRENGGLAVLSDGPAFSVLTVHPGELSTDAPACNPDTAPWADSVIFMSSGTSGRTKLCLYDGYALSSQVLSSGEIIQKCPAMKAHVDGELKQLALLPFFHVFGFIAVYIWFGFFSRTFVFLKDSRPETLVDTVRKHRVTHIFAVPLFWETVYEKTLSRIRQEGPETYEKFKKALLLSNRSPLIRNLLVRSSFKKIRDGLFGDSIRFMISGGGQIPKDVLSFFNGIGYLLVNGYGMTETGITSVELSENASERNLGSIGQPFSGILYSVSDDGELLIRSESMAGAVSENGTFEKIEKSEWFHSHDRAVLKKGRYYLLGRADELLILKNGENIDPSAAESALMTEGVRRLCLLEEDGFGVLIASLQNTSSPERIRNVQESLKKKVAEKGYGKSIRKLLLTADSLIPEDGFKMNRKEVLNRYMQGKIRFFSAESEEMLRDSLNEELSEKVRDCFAAALGLEKEKIRPDSDFFLDFGGTSLDYFQLLTVMEDTFGIRSAVLSERNPVSVKDFVILIEEVS